MSGFTYITAEEAFNRRLIKPCPSLQELKRMADNEGTCENCEAPIWKMADCGMCFTCTTGEATPDDDYELI